MIYHDGENDLNGLSAHVSQATAALAASYNAGEFDCIVTQGLSGLLVAIPVHLATQIPLIIVRKDGENSHGENIVNLKNRGSRALFLDDFISSGETKTRVANAIAKYNIAIVASYQYRNHCYGFEAPEEIYPVEVETLEDPPVGYSATCLCSFCVAFREASDWNEIDAERNIA